MRPEILVPFQLTWRPRELLLRKLPRSDSPPANARISKLVSDCIIRMLERSAFRRVGVIHRPHLAASRIKVKLTAFYGW